MIKSYTRAFNAMLTLPNSLSAHSNTLITPIFRVMSTNYLLVNEHCSVHLSSDRAARRRIFLLKSAVDALTVDGGGCAGNSESFSVGLDRPDVELAAGSVPSRPARASSARPTASRSRR